MTPYERLSRRMAPANESVLLNLAGVPPSVIWSALRHGRVIHSIVAFTAILNDFLIIAVAGVPFSQCFVFEAFLYSSYVSMTILGSMLLLITAIFYWRTRIKRLQLPRDPGALLSVCLILCDKSNGLRKECEGDGGGRLLKHSNTKYWASRARGDEQDIWWWCVGVEGEHGNLLPEN